MNKLIKLVFLVIFALVVCVESRRRTTEEDCDEHEEILDDRRFDSQLIDHRPVKQIRYPEPLDDPMGIMGGGPPFLTRYFYVNKRGKLKWPINYEKRKPKKKKVIPEEPSIVDDLEPTKDFEPKRPKKVIEEESQSIDDLQVTKDLPGEEPQIDKDDLEPTKDFGGRPKKPKKVIEEESQSEDDLQVTKDLPDDLEATKDFGPKKKRTKKLCLKVSPKEYEKIKEAIKKNKVFLSLPASLSDESKVIQLPQKGSGVDVEDQSNDLNAAKDFESEKKFPIEPIMNEMFAIERGYLRPNNKQRRCRPRPTTEVPEPTPGFDESKTEPFSEEPPMESEKEYNQPKERPTTDVMDSVKEVPTTPEINPDADESVTSEEPIEGVKDLNQPKEDLSMKGVGDEEISVDEPVPDTEASKEYQGVKDLQATKELPQVDEDYDESKALRGGERSKNATVVKKVLTHELSEKRSRKGRRKVKKRKKINLTEPDAYAVGANKTDTAEWRDKYKIPDQARITYVLNDNPELRKINSTKNETKI